MNTDSHSKHECTFSSAGDLPSLKGWDKTGSDAFSPTPCLMKIQSPLQGSSSFQEIFCPHNHLASRVQAPHLFLCSAVHGCRLNPILFLTSSRVLHLSSDTKHPDLRSDCTALSAQDCPHFRHKEQVGSQVTHTSNQLATNPEDSYNRLQVL